MGQSLLFLRGDGVIILWACAHTVTAFPSDPGVWIRRCPCPRCRLDKLQSGATMTIAERRGEEEGAEYDEALAVTAALNR